MSYILIAIIIFELLICIVGLRRIFKILNSTTQDSLVSTIIKKTTKSNDNKRMSRHKATIKKWHDEHKKE